jgi:5'-nucleotidase
MMEKRLESMRILVINYDVWAVAPETDDSGASHSLTLAEPLRMRVVAERRYAIKGTPADCVIMGVHFLLHDRPPDLVLSGVNRGQNLADDIIDSGTVAGTLLGDAVQCHEPRHRSHRAGAGQLENAHEVWAALLRSLLKASWPDGVFLNVNLPDCEPGQIKGTLATVQGQRDPNQLRVEDRLDARGRAYYWISIERRRSKPPKRTDLWAVRSDYISVTPLCLDFTPQETCRHLAAALDKFGTHATERQQSH